MAGNIPMKDRKDPIHEINNTLKAMSRELKYLREKVDMQVEEADHLITVKMASKMLHISEYTLRKEIREGNIRAKRHGNAYKMSYLYVQKLVNNIYK